jgi:hypothetical protein
MKSSCYFVFNHSVLLCPNLYSVKLHNTLSTRSILVLVLSTAEPSCTLFRCKRNSCYIAAAWTAQITQFYCCVAQATQKTSHVRATSPVSWRANSCLATSYNIRPTVACAYRGVFIEPLSGNALTCHNIFRRLLSLSLSLSLSMVLQPFIGLWPLFQFLNFIHSR